MRFADLTEEVGPLKSAAVANLLATNGLRKRQIIKVIGADLG